MRGGGEGGTGGRGEGIDKPEAGGMPGVRTWKPVLGLSDEPGEPLSVPVRTGTVYDQPEPEELIELTVIVPARDEEESLGACLESLDSKSGEVFKLGLAW